MTVSQSTSRFAFVLTFAGSVASAAFAQAPGVPDDRPVLLPLPSTASVKTAAAGAALLRQLYFLEDFNDGAALGDTLFRRFPHDGRVRAWYVGNLARTVRENEAEVLTARLDTASRDPWTLAARAFALMNDDRYRREARDAGFRLAERARRLAPADADLTWLAALALFNKSDNHWEPVLAYVDSVGPRVGNPAELRVVRANALFYIGRLKQPADTAKREQAYRDYAAIRAADPANINAIYFAADRLEDVHNDEALALIKRAVARSPRSTVIRSEYWSVINSQKGVATEDKKAQVAADRAQFLVLTDSAPWAIASAMSSMRSPKPDPGLALLEARLLGKAPHSGWAENLLLTRTRQWAESLSAARDTTKPGPKSDSTLMRQRYRASLEEFLARPWQVRRTAMGEAALSLFLSVRDDSTYPTAKLARVVKTMVDGGLAPNVSLTHGSGAAALAGRKVEFRYAEQLLRDGEKLAVQNIMDYPDGVFSTVGERADAVDGVHAQMTDARGWIYYNEGRLEDADKQFTKALDFSKRDATIYFHQGKLRAAQGRAEDAELSYVQGMTVRFRGVNPNRRELEAIYKAKHGSMDGWAPYLAALEEKERVSRREKILAKRDADAKAAKAFRLPNLEARVINSDSLKGRFVVVNFWGTWCGPCVAEMPELQQFYDKYRADSTVSVLTISNDKDLQDLKDWMVKRKLTIPTLFDDGYVGNIGLSAWPTTWFMDRDGKIQFVAIGNSGALVEEWSWRVEAMRAHTRTQP